MQKQVMIPVELFTAMVKYHLLDCREETQQIIRSGLEQKMDAFYRRGLYSEYKTSDDPEKREEARLKYLDERGVPGSFRW